VKKKNTNLSPNNPHTMHELMHTMSAMCTGPNRKP